jgi:ATP-dependent Lhr-like helicase
VRQVLLSLSEAGTIIVDELTEGEKESELCDSENMEYLLRLMRKRRQPSFTPLPPQFFSLFYATWQHLQSREDNEKRLKHVLEQLFGYPARVELWETDIFPARLPGYSPRLLNTLVRESELIWFGCGNGCISFALTEDRELFTESGVFTYPVEDQSFSFFPDMSGKYCFWDLLEHSGVDSAALTALLWDNVWKGVLSNESFEVVRKGILTGFRAEGFSKGKRESLSTGSTG